MSVTPPIKLDVEIDIVVPLAAQLRAAADKLAPMPDDQRARDIRALESQLRASRDYRAEGERQLRASMDRILALESELARLRTARVESVAAALWGVSKRCLESHGDRSFSAKWADVDGSPRELWLSEARAALA